MTRHSNASLLATVALLATLVGALLIGAPVSRAQTQTRGELLYSTHCIACHTSQMHWRDKRMATDWNSLVGQVRRWQAEVMLGWSEDDILAVARHLNQGIYRFAEARRSGRRRSGRWRRDPRRMNRAGANASAPR